MGKCYIFSGADINDYKDIEIQEDSYIICADAGYLHAERLGIKPDCVLGDFDTYIGSLPVDCEIIRYKAEKDDTDTMLAVKYAFKKGFKDICIYGALGGRFDHSIANIQTLQYIHANGGYGIIAGDNDIISLHGEETRQYKRLDGYYFSLFSLTERCEGITTKGTKYNLEGAVLENSFPLGVSNVILDDFAEIIVKKGLLLVIFSRDIHKNL